MPKKITKQIRRKMLAKHEEGATFPELKEQFSVTDTRTLMRNLQAAERERDEREVRIRICTDSQQLHLEEIRELATRYQEKLKVNFPTGDFDLSVEDDDLFESLREHFPDTTFWANYTNWKGKARGYKKLWGELAEIGNSKAEQNTGLKGPVGMTEGLAASFVPSALWYAIYLREKWMEDERKGLAEQNGEEFRPAVAKLYKRREIGASCPYALEFVPDRQDIAWGIEESVSKCIETHYALIKTYWGNPEVIKLVELRERIWSLESQINRELRLALLKRSYISHTCGFCPVRAFTADAI